MTSSTGQFENETKTGADTPQPALTPLSIPEALTVHDLAATMDVGAVEVIKELMRRGFMFTVNDVIAHDIAESIAPAFGYNVSRIVEAKSSAPSLVISTEDESPDLLSPRPPVVTILGHVDHGKTTLLDRIRKSNVAEQEAGGITQHIGAYRISHQSNQICFLDTPGHEAFTAMRSRGAQVTDIVVLVVAADDGVMPQTSEAIDHARAANVPIVVAITKIDLPSADLDKVNRQLAEQDILIESWGGDTIAVPVSGTTGEGVTELLENLLLVAEVAELKANPKREAKGVVVEARVDKSRGPIAAVIVQTGTLRVGDQVVVNAVRGKIKAMFDDKGARIVNAGPSEPVEILGLSSLPEAGDVFDVAPNEKTARKWIDDRNREIVRASTHTLQEVHARIQSGEAKALELIVKTDVQGSIEAVRGVLDALNTEEAKVNVLRIASGTITEQDILLAVASKAIIIGFNTGIEAGAKALANQERVEIREYSVIYHLSDDIKSALSGLLSPKYRQVIEGRATVRAIFNLGKRDRVAGIYVNDGRIGRDSIIHIIRAQEKLYEGNSKSLKHFKDDVREIANGFEGGISVEGFNDFIEGDLVEAYRTEQVR